MIENPNIKGPSVYAKKQNDSTPCYIPFSKDSGDKPVIATEQYVDARCKLLEETIASLDERIKALEGSSPSHKDEKAFLDLFKNKENGFLYDFNNLSGMFQDVDGKIPVTEPDQYVRKVLDASGNGNHLVCADVAPKLALNKETGAYYLRFTGKEALWCEKHSIGKTHDLTLISHVTRDFKNTSGYEMYFSFLNTTMRLCCYARENYMFMIDRYLTQKKAVDSKTNHNTLVGSVSLTKPELALKVDDIWSKTTGDKSETTELPSVPFIIGNSDEARGSNGVVGGMYALIGVSKYWDDISLSPIEEVFKERCK